MNINTLLLIWILCLVIVSGNNTDTIKSKVDSMSECSTVVAVDPKTGDVKQWEVPNK